MADANTGKKPSLFANILAIVGFIILIIIVIWGLIHLARLSSPWFSSLFGNGDTEISVSAPNSIASGQPAKITWEYDTDTPGSFAFLYPCVDGISVAVPAPENTFAPIRCGTATILNGATSTLIVYPLSTATSSQKMTITMLFVPSAEGATEPEATGSATMTVNPATGAQPTPPVGGSTSTPNTPSTPSNPKPTTPKPTTPTTPNPKPTPSGPSDLSVTILGVNSEPGGVTAVVFDIKNIGASSTGQYTFTAQLPTAQPYTYYSPIQASLAPSAHIVNTLRFTMGIPGTVSISVDPTNSVRESNESNNYVNQALGGSYNPNPYYGY